MRHLLVTNDFPPKIGGIQSYLWELWRRLPPDEVTVLTSRHRDAERFDAEQRFDVRRTREPVLLPTPVLARHIRGLAAEVDARLLVIDPALPLGHLGPTLGRPYAVVLHGAEVAVPGRLPGTRQLLSRVIRGSSLLIAAGGYPEAEARRAAGPGGPLPPVVVVPPGVDLKRFTPMVPLDRAATRARLGLPAEGPLVLSVSRLVPRKGMDTLIAAAAKMSARHPDLTVAVAGVGRDRARLDRLVRRSGAPVRLLGRISDLELPDLYACADVFTLCCRHRWGGLEQEGFGIVFLEAAAAGVASVAGDSGGAAEAVVDGSTGLVVSDPGSVEQLAEAIGRLIDDPALCRRLGFEARDRVVANYGYGHLAERLGAALARAAETRS